MISLISSFSLKVRPITYPKDENNIFDSFSLAILDKRPVKGPKEIFQSFSIGIKDEGIENVISRFIRVR